MGILKGIAMIVLAVLIDFIMSFITGVIVMYLWNWLMPDIFGLTTITYWQGIGIAFLCSILFKPSISTKE